MTDTRELIRIAGLVREARGPGELRRPLGAGTGTPGGADTVSRMLLLGLWGRFADKGAVDGLYRLASPGRPALARPVVFLAGGTDRIVEAQMQRYRDLLVGAFAGLGVTLICGGTTAGVAGLAGDVGALHPRIRTIGYVPGSVPPGVTVDRDPRRYRELRTTGGTDFSPLESLQAWTDIAASGLGVSDVSLLGINGGEIAAVEYRVALALGARVGILEGSGREADRLLADPAWPSAPMLEALPPDTAELARFLAG